MKAAGIDISNNTSNNVNDYIDIDLDYVITVCDNAKERCPYFPTTAKKQHHSFEDPANATGTDVEQLLVYRQVRDQIKDYMKEFAENNLNNS